jgi:putative transposase
MKYGFIHENRFEWAVQKICRVLEVSRSGYYEWVKAGFPNEEAREAVLVAKIRQAERDHHGNLGVERMHRALKEEQDTEVSRRLVQRIMHKYGIKARRCGKYKPQTTTADPQAPVYPNLLEQCFTVERPSQVWLADITYISVGRKWAYLAVVLDLFDRKPVGWALGRSPSAELACTALRRALKRRKPSTGLIHHSDRGCQYTSNAYRKLLEHHRITGSMSRKGNPYDNAPMESFFKTLKVEWVNWCTYRDMSEALSSLFYYIDVYYCCKRIHSALGFKTPKNYENRTLPAI